MTARAVFPVLLVIVLTRPVAAQESIRDLTGAAP